MDLVQDLPQREQPGQSKVAQATHLIYTLAQMAEQIQRRRLHREPTADPALAEVGQHLDAVEQALGRAAQRHAAGDVQRETALAGAHLEDATNATPPSGLGSTKTSPGTSVSGAVVDLGEARAALARARQALAAGAGPVSASSASSATRPPRSLAATPTARSL